MENKKDNIDKLVSGMLKQPGALKRTLQQLVSNTEESYLAFRDVRERHTALAHWIEEHPDIELCDIPGKLYRILVNDTQVYDDAVFDTATILAPQFVMFDDRYMQEKIEEEMQTETPI